ncbi:MAG: hypothetical protein OEM77_07125 [Nitrosopumilus sp.]|nr:hypothetical protein [Nitrosopumilus sp.]MDH3736095.1 hypothetical protein [Nitrosopumilus sp.]MDH3822455.1 hypothetical protein [Nitrosopumilus sp.]MDH3832902.1 hypothetical protein [Nitrosopumilus sp.]
MTQQILLDKHDQKMPQPDMVGSDAKNALPTTLLEINTMDLMGLSWIFAEEDYETC